MAEFPALNLYTDAFLADTPHLGALETGAYMSLLMASWRTEDGGLADDDVMLARMARCEKREWKRIRPVVMAFWTMCQDGKWRQKRLEIERENARAKSQSAARSAKARWLKDNKRQDADAERTQCGEVCESHATTSTSITTSEEVDRPSPEPAREDDLGEWPSGHDGSVLSRPPSDNRSRGARTPGDVLSRFMRSTGPPEKRLKLQSKADTEMANWLMTREGKKPEEAWRAVQIARDEDHPDQLDHARYLEKLSRKHKLGWFAEETA